MDWYPVASLCVTYPVDLQLPPRYSFDTDDPLLGEGGMGRVWRVRDVVLDTAVALKVVRPDLAADVRFRKLFDLEVRTAARFTHPNIVPLHDSGELPDGTPYLGLALAQDGSFAVLRTEMPVWHEILRLTLELLDALGHLHAYGVLHRDLKPENVLLARVGDGRRHAWLADLGLANASSTLAKRKGRVEGTPGFMAPEQKLGLPREYGPWTDLYSLGVILWELVTGSMPFGHNRSPLDSELPPLIPQPGLLIPAGLDLILTNLLDAEPLSRYDLCADLRTELLCLGAPEIDEDYARAMAKGSRQVLVGTVAPAAPTPSPVTSGYQISQVSGSAASSSSETIAFFDDEPESKPSAQLQLGVPGWNRPTPFAMPEDPLPEPGIGATARGSLALFALREIPLVGRDEERFQIWDQACLVAEEGRSRVVLVVGETGAGKSRVVDSVMRLLEEGGWAEAITMAYNRPASKDDGYAGAARDIVRPWNESRPSLEQRLRRRLARERGAMDAVVTEEAAMLCRWAGFVNEGEEPVPAGFGLREVYRYLEARSWRGVSCLVLDDAHLAAEDGDGLAIAEAVLQSTEEEQRQRILVVATIAAEEVRRDPALAERIDGLVAAGAHRVDISRLDRDGTRELLREYLTLTPDLAEMVAARCEGNALFARQLLLDWAERGWLVHDESLEYRLADGVDIHAALPSDARELFTKRIEDLAQDSGDPERYRQALFMASLCGSSAPADLWSSIAGPELYAYLRSTGLWVESGERVRFDHGLLHQTVRAQVDDQADIERLHKRLANAWIGYGAVSGIDVALEIGRHAHAGGDHRLALEHLLKACESAYNRGRNQELQQAADLAVDCCARGDGLKNLGGWPRVWRARAHEVSGEAQAAGDLFYRARMMFQEVDDYTGVIESYVGMGWSALQLGNLSQAERRYGDAMKWAKTETDLRLEAKAIEGLAWVEQQKRNFDGADILFTRVLNRMASLEDEAGQAEAALGQAYVARQTGRFSDAEELYQEAVENFQAGDDLLGVARAVVGRGIVARQRLKLDKAEALFKESAHIAEELGASKLANEARLGLGDLYRLREDYDRAESAYRNVMRWAERQGFFETAVITHLLLAQNALAREDLDTMYRESNEAARHLETNPGHWLWAPYRLVVATMLALRNDEDNAYRWLWSAAELGLGDTVDHDQAYLLTVICHVAKDQRWQNTMRVAGKLAVEQWKRLDQKEEADYILGMAKMLLGTG